MSINRVWRLLVLMLSAVPSLAQTTTVTGTVVDPNGNPYASGTASAFKAVAAGQNPGPPTNVTTNASGSFTMSLTSPASYQFTVCAPPVNIGPTTNPTPKLVCFTSAPIAISGVSQDVSATLNVIAAQLGPVGSVATNVGANLAFTGNNTHSGTETFTGPQTVGKSNGNCIVDGTANATLAAAVTCAGTSGVIEIPMSGVPALTANVTIPAGVTLRFDGPSAISTTGFTLTVNGPIVAPPVQIFSGTGTIALGMGTGPIRAIWFPGADILAQMQNAYNAEPALSGNTIYVDSNPAGGCWTATSTASFSTVNKYAIFQGIGPSTGNNANPGGTCINYTPTTATSAITIDWTPAAGGGYATGAGLRDITLSNNLCSTNGGCGSSAVGISIGAVNGGAHKALFLNVKVSGFGNAYKVSDAGGVGWGISWVNSTISWNTTGINYTVVHENDTWSSGAMSVNGTHIALVAGSELTVEGGSVDSATTCGISMAGNSTLHTTDVHWENSGQSNIQYVCGAAASEVDIVGGQASDDTTTGSTAQNWFTVGIGSTYGLTITSAGRTYTGQVFNVLTRYRVDVFNNSPTIFSPNTICFLTNGACMLTETVNISGVQGFSMFGANSLTELAAAPTRYQIAGLDTCYGDSTSHALKCSYNGGAFGQIVVLNGVNAQTGTTYTFVAADVQKLATFNNAGAVAVTLPQATTVGFGAGTSFHVRNLGAGTATITPTTSTIDGAASLALTTGQGADIYSDGANYETQKGGVALIASGTATMTTAAIAAGACGTTVTVAAAGVLATDAIIVSFNATPAGTNAGLVSWPTAGNVNFAYCPGVAETPAAATLNWRVVR